MTEKKLNEIAAMLRGELLGNGEMTISRTAKIQEAECGDITFLANPKYEKHLQTTKASAVIVSKTLGAAKTQRTDIAYIKVDDPYLSFLRAETLRSLHSCASDRCTSYGSHCTDSDAR